MEKGNGNELEWIMKCSRNQIFFRDELQTVRPCDMTTEDFITIIHENCSEPIVKLKLSSQWRCMGGDRYISYIKNIFSEIAQEPQHFENYELKLFEDVDEMVGAIKSKNAEFGLCRNAAGYAWSWASKKDKAAYDIEIQGNKYRWNSTYKNWIATENSINEIGCIHTLQGYDLNYVGVIIGKDLRYNTEKNCIESDKRNYFDQQGKSGVADDPERLTQYLKNIYLTLMTRGIKGTYVYICDDALKEYMRKYFIQ